MRRVTPQFHRLLQKTPTLPLVAVIALLMAAGLALAATQSPSRPPRADKTPLSASNQATPATTSNNPSTSSALPAQAVPKVTASKPAAQKPALSTASPVTPNSNPSLPQPQVTLTLIEPDGTFSFNVPLSAGQTLCDNLTAAKSAGLIRSVTIDYSYLATFHSAYVREINGYQNNWLVKAGGISPQGCSLYQPKAGDSIEWKYQ